MKILNFSMLFDSVSRDLSISMMLSNTKDGIPSDSESTSVNEVVFMMTVSANIGFFEIKKQCVKNCEM
jgi:hypothetical protein